MRCVEDRNRFDRLLNFLTGEIVQEIKQGLEQADIEPELAKKLTGEIAFGIGAIVDGSRIMEFQGESVEPVLTFLIKEDQLLHAGGGSWMHEYALGWAEDAFET